MLRALQNGMVRALKTVLYSYMPFHSRPMVGGSMISRATSLSHKDTLKDSKTPRLSSGHLWGVGYN